MKRISEFSKALLMALLLALITSGVALAITIAVDGDRETAWDGGGGQTPGTATDVDEAGINDNVDIENVQWTNDQANFYFLVDVYASAPLMPPLAVIDICLDTDDNASTDIPVSNVVDRDRCSYDTGVSGIDTIIEAYRLNNGVMLVDVFDATTYPKTYVGAGTLGYDPSGATTPVVEVSVAFSDLGFEPGVCPSNIPMVVFYNGGDTNDDDNLPNEGSTSINCGLPTAVTLADVDAGSGVASMPVVGLVALVIMGGAGLSFWKRRE
jgi:hypothetical protein